MLRKMDASQIYLLMRAMMAFGFRVVFGINMIYQVVMVGLNPLQLVLVGTTLELSAFIFEIPTGVLADVYSRRLSVIIGFFIIGIGFWIEAIPNFAVILLAQVIWGLGYTFISGASDAWIVDEIGNDKAKKIFMQAQRISIAVGLIALWVSIGLGVISLNLPHLIGGSTLILLSVILWLFMPEDGFQRVPKEARETWNDLFKTLREGIKVIRASQVLALIVVSSLLIGLFSEGWDRLQTAHLLANFGLPDPSISINTLILFGVIGSIGSVIAYAGNTWLEKQNLQSDEQLSTALMFAYGTMGFGILAFAWSGNIILALCCLWAVDMARNISHPLFTAWINNHIESNVRATVLSVASQADAIGQIAGGAPIGYIGILSSIRVAISVSGMLLLPVVLLVARIRQLGRNTISRIAQ